MENKNVKPEIPKDDFRESLGTMDDSGKRVWIFPKKPSGPYYRKRTIVSYFLLAIFFGLPILNFVRVEKGLNPFFQLNLIKREFYLFGNYFQPDDFYILAVGTIVTVVFIIVFTVIWGRVFCGWVCPQTIFLEMVFRKIEYAIDGNRSQQIKLSKAPWDAEKTRKRILKYGIYLILSTIIAFNFLSVLTGPKAVIDLFRHGISENVDTFVGLFIFTGLFFFVFAWFREQACTLVCPYGRFQGVLVDKKTVTVAYDFKRGEGKAGRAKWNKNVDRKAEGIGDCIDCKQCVLVCPTGIDIRNASNQLECINCTACMDACDEVMEKVGFPTGLIRYASEENIEEGTKFKVSTRAWAYTAVITILMIVITTFLINRPTVRATFSRVPGADFESTDSTYINPFNYILTNKTSDTLSVYLKVISPPHTRIDNFGAAEEIKLMPKENKKGLIKIVMPIGDYNESNQPVDLGIYNTKEQMLDEFEVRFLGPVRTF